MSSLPPNAIAEPPSADALQQDVAKLLASPDHHLLTRGSFELFIFRKEHAPTLFFELCRQREITFRLSGQGTGHPFDETPEDEYYDQLLLWDTTHQRIAGCYRFGQTKEVIARGGQSALYLTHMFDFEDDFFSRDENALELTRSFVAPDYQSDRLALPLLWQVMGSTGVRLGGARLFGCVTLSNDYSEESRALMVSWMTQYRTRQPHSLAKARHKFPVEVQAGSEPDRNIDELKSQIVDRDGNPKPIPALFVTTSNLARPSTPSTSRPPSTTPSIASSMSKSTKSPPPVTRATSALSFDPKLRRSPLLFVVFCHEADNVSPCR